MSLLKVSVLGWCLIVSDPNFISTSNLWCCNPWPHGEGMWRWGLWEIVCLGMGPSGMQLVPLLKQTTGSHLAPLPCEGSSGNRWGLVHELGRRLPPPPDTRFALPWSRTCQATKCLLLISLPVCTILPTRRKATFRFFPCE